MLDTVGFHLVTFKITFKVLFQWDKNCRILIITTVIAFSSSDFELLTVVEAVHCFCSSEKAFKNLLGLWETMGSPLQHYLHFTINLYIQKDIFEIKQIQREER